MRLRLLILVAVGLLAAPDKPKEQSVQKDIRKLLGGWKIIRAQAKGERVKGYEDDLVFGKSKVRWNLKGLFIRGPYTLDPTKNPKQITATWGDAGKWLGIYQLIGDRLTICWGTMKRPTTFATDAKSETVLLTLRRKRERP